MASNLITAQGIKRLGTILGVWAHPDDESFMSAGLMAVAVQNGQTVACITATKGELGVQDESRWPAATLGETRASELESAFNILGIKYHHWLGYIDGSCCKLSDKEAVKKISAYIAKYQPDTVITFPPDGSTGHLDHVSVSRWAREAVKQSGHPITLYYAVDLKEQYDAYFRALDEKFDIYFNIDEPQQVPSAECDLLLRLSPEIASLKCDALIAMPSQTNAMFETVGKAQMCQALGLEGYVAATKSRKWGKPRLDPSIV